VEKGRKKGKRYSPDFKEEALARCLENGVTQTSQELGVCQATLNRWKKESSESGRKGAKNKPTYEELEKENRRLKKENGWLEEINRVLKKSTAIFSSNHLGGSK
jgi:transposase